MIETAWAQTGGGGGPEGQPFFVSLVPFLLIFVIFYFLLIRPQMKRQKKLATMHKSLKKGDRVYTQGGILGDVIGRKDKEGVIVLRVGEDTKIEVLESAISGIRGQEESG